MSNLSFLPEDYLERKTQRRTAVIILTLFAVVMAGLFGAFYVTDQARKDIRDQQQVVNHQFEEAANRLEQLDRLQARKQQMIHKARVTGVLVEKVPRSLMMSELVNNMPDTVSLTELTLETTVNRSLKRKTASALDQAKQAAAAGAAGLSGDAARVAEIEVPITEVAMTLSGLAPTDVEVAQFINALTRCKLFSDLNLAYSEEVVVNEQTMRRYRIELKLNQDLDLRKFEPTVAPRQPRTNPLINPVVPPPKAPTAPPSGSVVIPGGGPSPDAPAGPVPPAPPPKSPGLKQ